MMQKKRTYNVANRAAQATETRSRILTSAKKLFKNEGFDRVTISLLASDSQVSMPTIYALFKSKRGVLQALIDEALPPEQFTKLVDRAMKETCPKKHLALSAKIARQIYDAERELMDILRGAQVVAPEFKELEHEREVRRYERQKGSISMIAKQNALAKEITPKKARDILWALTGRDLYRLFVIDRGWSSDTYEKWLAELLAKSLVQESVVEPLN
jgi:AcrR family transcriptional regulator